jgi:hypothetical protein
VPAAVDGSVIVVGVSGASVEHCRAGVRPWSADAAAVFAGRLTP